MMTTTTISFGRGIGLRASTVSVASSTRHSSLQKSSCSPSSLNLRAFTTTNNKNKSSSSSTSSTNNMLWQIATFGVVGTTFVVVGNYFSDKSWRYEEEEDSSGAQSKVKPPQAEVTSRTYFDVTIDKQPVGRIVMGLHGNVVPRTVRNFETICRGGGDRSSSSSSTTSNNNVNINKNMMTYEGSIFHRIIPRFMIQGGEKPGRSIYESKIHFDGRFNDENFQLKHIGPGILSMANAGPNTNTSQFFITTTRTSHLDGRHVVFGTVLEGYDVVELIEMCGSSSGKPRRRVVIAKSGVLGDDEGEEGNNNNKQNNARFLAS